MKPFGRKSPEEAALDIVIAAPEGEEEPEESLEMDDMDEDPAPTPEEMDFVRAMRALVASSGGL